MTPTTKDRHAHLGIGLLQGPNMERRRMSKVTLYSTQAHKIARRP